MSSNQDQTPRRRQPRRRAKDRVVIFDTTLRDGEQCPGATMTFEEKLEVAELLDEMGVDIIEAGFPDRLEPGRFRERPGDRPRGQEFGDLRACPRAAEGHRPSAPTRSSRRGSGRIHTFIGTSPLHRKYQMSIDEAEVLSRVTASVTRARGYTDDVEWSAMDATRTEVDFLCRCVEAAIKAGATTVNIPDTVGYATPDEFAALIRMIIERVPNADKASCSPPIATTISGWPSPIRWRASAAGARQVECAVNGLGERAGNAALEEIVMAIRTRGDAMPFWTGIDTTMLTRASKLVSPRDRLPGAVQQGDRRAERLRA